MSFTYTNGIPDTPNNPSADQPNMKTNTNSISSILAVDHIGFNAANGGYHNIIHLIPQISDPAAIPGPPQINQIYQKSYTPNTTAGVADSQLFIESALGIISQMTGYKITSQEGYQWLGGILIQWGVVKSANISGSFASGFAKGTTTFKDRAIGMIPFTNNCFNVFTIPFYESVSNSNAPNSEGSVSVNNTNNDADGFALKKTSFTWVFNSNSSDFDGFYWLAIGN